ncbi:MAG TPA: hypothetical protein VHE81_23375, partial [Lacipirellulaceae bacterium]|nr:hypothetical protein [Lacipirellulaceae bacterium]
MTEYNRAPGRGHHGSAGVRPMQVDRQPSPWPCAAILLVLLLLCLIAPHYWQDSTQPAPAIGAARDIASERLPHGEAAARLLSRSTQTDYAGLSFDFASNPIGQFANSSHSDLVDLVMPPTIDQLVALHSA